MLKLIGIAPHPAIIIPSIGRSELPKVKDTVEGMRSLAARFREAKPELLIIITPHGQVLREGPAVSIQAKLHGDFGQFGFPDIKLSFQTDEQLVAILKEETEREPLKPVFLEDRFFRFSGRYELDHGAMVPLYFLQEAGLDIPGLHMAFGFNPYHDLYRFGSALRRAVERRGLPAAVLASGDLSHRLIPGAPAGYSPRGAEFDQKLIEYIRDKKVDDLLSFDPGLVEEAGECGLRSFIIALGMIAGSDYRPEIFSYEGPFGVGYLVAALHPPRGDHFTLEGEGKKEKASGNPDFHPPDLARRVLQHYLDKGTIPDLPQSLLSQYKESAGAFVSLKKDGQLRGCIGTIEPVRRNLAEEIAANAVSAAIRDPRFPPVRKEELPELSISVDILSPPERIKNKTDLDPKKYGVIVRSGSRTGLLLPDLEGVDTVEEQLDIARRKAGILPGEPVELYRFKVTRYGEK
ncbi:MAG: AmmeMemoRadiSam system protein A [Bacillota bacterium]|nr:AmmeMemoRadiSam system protein A [Bacillota bacterium]